MANLDGPPYYDSGLGDVAVPAAVAPLSTPPFGSFPSMRTSCIVGAPKLLDTIVSRDAIPAGLRAEGMTAYVQATQETWQLQGGITNLDWVLISGAAAGSTVVTRPYSGLLSVGDAVYQDGAGNVQRASASAYSTGRVVGLVLAVDTPVVGQAQVVLIGTLTGFVGLTPGAAYILGTTAGSIVAETDTVNPAYPSAPGNVVQVVGIAASATDLSVDLSQTLIVL
ncbi:MAG: hypothetical protein IT371_30660 [Deltaproteobacteria bacterium]|nr:hypothetical protein [Deltaproteobacteria bacterium]